MGDNQDYIHKHVNPVLENLVTEVLLARPDSPVPFMVRWLAKKTKSVKDLDTGEAVALRDEIQALRKEALRMERHAAVRREMPDAAAPPAAVPPADLRPPSGDESTP